jgi:hypothetical protein
VIATQTKYHYQQIIKALRYKKHVFVEKPICLNANQAKSAIELTNEIGSLLFVDHIYTTNPYIVKIKETLASDSSNLIKYDSFRYNEECKLFDTSIIENLMYHDFYIADLLVDNIDLSNEMRIIEHIPFEWCQVNIGPIRLLSSYKDMKTRLLEIKTENTEIYWDELDNRLEINGDVIEVDTTLDNINHKFNDVYHHLSNNVDDGSKEASLSILKSINQNGV